ncbi:hypothetical protein SAMN04487773_3265 [Enterobacter sp. kpr-6]|uniref:hypothetical protein n=1 Tax=Enterobacter sp. kpr-6 TaxID=1761782 RepID=UPI0008E3D793|nr:hypothetical protein [Enterobacter sp. kpr-6]SFR13920.1 hypothetical protein SAMN04487773_3265 [Enterobacter sp. kpr-6]
MSGSDTGFEVVYRGQMHEYFIPGTRVFFQRLKEYGGGYWLGRVYDDAFIFDIERPVSLAEGMDYILISRKVESSFMDFEDESDPNLSLF